MFMYHQYCIIKYLCVSSYTHTKAIFFIQIALDSVLYVCKRRKAEGDGNRNANEEYINVDVQECYFVSLRRMSYHPVKHT